MMNSNQGSEYTNGLALAIREVYKTLPGGNRPKVTVLDKETITGLAYSNIVISLVADEGSVNYYIIELEATGRKPMRATDIITEVTNAMRQPGARPNIYTTDDGIDTVLHEAIIKLLVKEHGNKEFISVDGVVVGTNHPDNAVIVPKLAAIGYNACTIDSGLSSGRIEDLNIYEAKIKSPSTVLKFETNMMKNTPINEVGKPVRADFTVDLNAVDTSNQITSINLQNARNQLVSITGFVDAIPEEIAIPTMPGMAPTTSIKLHPHIILNSASVYTPTPGYMLLAIVSSLVMTNADMWLGAVAPKTAKDLHNVGALNLMTNLGNNQNRIGEVLDLTSKKISQDESYALIKQMYSLAPIALAATPGGSDAKYAAAEEIIMSAHKLTNGKFPSTFSKDAIFANTGNTIPTGSFMDKSGEKDIREIDLAFIATQTSDISMMNEWALSNLPKSAGGKDPYFTKVDIISKLIPDAEISGKAIRVMFSAEFIDALSQAAALAGLNAVYTPEITFLENNSISVMSNYLGSAGIGQGAAGFARQNVPQSGFGNYNMNNINMGQRFY